jgi:signal transduction histidine kinase
MMERMTSASRRIGKRDIAIAAVLSLLGALLMVENVRRLAEEVQDPDATAAVHVGNLVPYWLAVPLFLLVTVPLLWRRAAPLPAVEAAFAGLLVNELLLGTEVLRSGVVLAAAFLFAFTAGAQLDAREARIGLALAAGLGVVDTVVSFGPWTAAIMAGLAAAFWGIGRVVRSRKRIADELLARTAELHETRDERARLEVASDRARLSRELDELLQRRLGELARLADEGARPSDAAGATARLMEIERESRRTLDEMRATVGVLRDDSPDLPAAPQPTLTHLEAMLIGARGADARLAVEGSPRPLPAALELSAYRIIEQLLDALEDAPDVEVRVRFGDDALELAVAGRARRRGKASIQRARERARLQSGTIETTTRGSRLEAVASLPVLAAV